MGIEYKSLGREYVHVFAGSNSALLYAVPEGKQCIVSMITVVINIPADKEARFYFQVEGPGDARSINFLWKEGMTSNQSYIFPMSLTLGSEDEVSVVIDQEPDDGGCSLDVTLSGAEITP